MDFSALTMDFSVLTMDFRNMIMDNGKLKNSSFFSFFIQTNLPIACWFR